LDHEQYESITDVLRTRMMPDSFTGCGMTYSIRTLYYDTPFNAFISESLSNRRYKEKIRLRTYDEPQPDDSVYIEIKKKISGVSSKRRCKMPLNEAYRFLESGQLDGLYEKGDTQILREIRAMLFRYDMGLKPTALVSSDRLALSGQEDVGLRITFDTNLRGRTHDLLLESGSYGDRLLDPESVVMEIKALKSMPLWLSSLLTSSQVFPRSFSKYRTMYHSSICSKMEMGLQYG
jgi:hypothetical protein